MPLYGFRGVYFAEYHNTEGVVSYDAPFTPGCPIRAQLELQFADGTLWCRDAQSIYRRIVTGGNVTFEAKALSPSSQVRLFGATLRQRSVTYTENEASVTKTIDSVVHSADDKPPYVGFAGYGPDAVDDESDKYCCFFVGKAKFSPPTMNLQTINGSIVFQTPTTTGRFLPDDSSGRAVQEVAICDSEAEAQAWCAAVFPQTQAQGGGGQAGSPETQGGGD